MTLVGLVTGKTGELCFHLSLITGLDLLGDDIVRDSDFSFVITVGSSPARHRRVVEAGPSFGVAQLGAAVEERDLCDGQIGRAGHDFAARLHKLGPEIGDQFVFAALVVSENSERSDRVPLLRHALLNRAPGLCDVVFHVVSGQSARRAQRVFEINPDVVRDPARVCVSLFGVLRIRLGALARIPGHRSERSEHYR